MEKNTILIADRIYQFSDYNRYDATMIDARHKEEMRDTQFPKDLERAYELGKRLVNAAK